MTRTLPASEVMWFISGQFSRGVRFFYAASGCPTRRGAIEDHEYRLGQTWNYCRKKGDRAIKCAVTPLKENSRASK